MQMRTSRLHARFTYGYCAAQLACYSLLHSLSSHRFCTTETLHTPARNPARRGVTLTCPPFMAATSDPASGESVWNTRSPSGFQ